MEQQDTMEARLEELETERLTLLAPTGTTFGPVRTETRALVPTTRAAETYRSPSMQMTHVRHVEVDDLHDIFGTESRVRSASVGTEKRALRLVQQQQHFRKLRVRVKACESPQKPKACSCEQWQKHIRHSKQSSELIFKLCTDNYPSWKLNSAKSRNFNHVCNRSEKRLRYNTTIRPAQLKKEKRFSFGTRKISLTEKNRQREREIELAEQVRAAGEAHRAREMAQADQARRMKEKQQTREARLGEEARRVGLDQAYAGRVPLSAAQRCRRRASRG
uniref:Uncharacterized protein n=1 Tax=Peronospora matthiolae TaxID=2874970 RepID=A0AAV1U4D2_9STRA